MAVGSTLAMIVMILIAWILKIIVWNF
jgi:hypothetical protein